jgi:5-methylthioadenosine/S-adenosylhomocysteine deaminase
MVPGQAPVEDMSILIRGDRILDICPSETLIYSRDVLKIDARRGMIIPGLVNGHCHSAMTLFRGFSDDLPLKQWLYEKIFPAEARFLNPDTVYWGTLLACLEMISSGTTSCIDSYFFEDSAVRAFHEAGLRVLVAQGVIDFPAPGVDNPKDNVINGRAFVEKWVGFSELINPSLFCHSPTTCSEKTLLETFEVCQKYQIPLQTHLSETADEVEEVINRSGKRPVLFLNDLGLLSDRLIAAHAVHLDQDEIECLAENKVKLVHVPESNMKLASGVAPIPEMVKRGLSPALGTDGCASNNNLDLFQEMDTAAKLGKVMAADPVCMEAGMVLKMATAWGAEVMGLGKEIGTLEIGKKADLVVIDLDNPHLIPLYHPISTLVYAAHGADVKDVIVNGKVLLKDKEFQTLDHQEILSKVNEISREIEPG